VDEVDVMDHDGHEESGLRGADGTDKYHVLTLQERHNSTPTLILLPTTLGESRYLKTGAHYFHGFKNPELRFATHGID
jgi:hypothetical protein